MVTVGDYVYSIVERYLVTTTGYDDVAQDKTS